MKKFLALVLALVMALSLAACGGDKNADNGDGGSTATKQLRFVTGGESGTYYGFGSVIATHATNNAGVNVVALSSDGSKANVFSLEENEAELGFCQSDVMAYAYNGTNIFADSGKVDCFSVLAALYTEQVQIVTTNPDIKSVADLEGKSVSVGAPASGVYFNAVDIMSAYGIGDMDADGKFTKINATYQSFSDSADALKNGQIDAAFIVAGAPTTAVADLAATKSVNLVSLDDEHIAKLLESSPYYTKCVIPAETYGMAGDVTTVGVGAVVLVRDDVSEDAVYALCADIFDNAASLVDTHAKYGEISLDYGASMTAVPYHAGAAKYFAEKGFTVPTK